MIDKKFLKNLFGFSTISWIAFVLSFVATIILTRVYSPSELGAISIFLSLTTVFQVAVSMGQDQYIVRKYYETENKIHLIFKMIIIEVIAWGVLIVISLLFSPYFSKMIFGEVNNFALILSVIISFPLSIIRIGTQVSKLDNNIFEHGKQILVFNFVSRLVVIGVGFINKDYNTYILFYFVTVIFVSIWIGIRTFRRFPNEIKIKNRDIISSIRIGPAVKYGFPIMISSVFFIAKDLVPRVILREYGSLYDVGILGAAMTLASSINIVVAGFNTYFSAYYFENYEKDRGQINIIHHTLVFILLLSMILLGMLSPLISFLVGEKFREAGKIFPIIALFSISQVISETTVHGINVKGKTYIHVFISLAVISSITITSYLLTSYLGVLGIAISYGFGGVIFYFLRTVFGQKNQFNISKIYKTHFSIFGTFIIGIINYVYYDNHVTRIVLLLIIAVIVISIYYKNIMRFISFLKKSYIERGKQ